ncbi:MAG: hypothetical protein JWM76_3567 [Pseudonocardiales bacterium]|nr:hypothetical protein [Pseudonocardiales bacterium]
MTYVNTLAVPAPEAPDTGIEAELCYLSSDVVELIAEVDAILCAALQPHRCPPAPPATRCTLGKHRPPGRWWIDADRRRSGARRRVRAVGRGPPIPPRRATAATIPRKAGEYYRS